MCADSTSGLHTEPCSKNQAQASMQLIICSPSMSTVFKLNFLSKAVPAILRLSDLRVLRQVFMKRSSKEGPNRPMASALCTVRLRSICKALRTNWEVLEDI